MRWKGGKGKTDCVHDIEEGFTEKGMWMRWRVEKGKTDSVHNIKTQDLGDGFQHVERGMGRGGRDIERKTMASGTARLSSQALQIPSHVHPCTALRSGDFRYAAMG